MTSRKRRGKVRPGSGGRKARKVFLAAAVLTGLLIRWLKLLRPATVRAFREAGGWRSMLDFRFPSFFVYGRWTNLLAWTQVKFVFRNVQRKGPDACKKFADGSHAKVIPRENAEAIIKVEEDIPLRDLEQVIPYEKARDLVISAPPEIAVMHCMCRSTRESPCLPDDVCLWVGQPFVDFVLEQNPRSRRATREEALDIIDAEAKRGHFQTAWFGPYDRFYAICNCCGCCCGAVEAMQKYGIPMIAPSGYIASLDPESCKACGDCREACFFNAIEVAETAMVNLDVCMGCGICVRTCPNGALSLIADAEKGIPLDIAALGDAPGRQ